jgi:hypothetical protein
MSQFHGRLTKTDCLMIVHFFLYNVWGIHFHSIENWIPRIFLLINRRKIKAWFQYSTSVIASLSYHHNLLTDCGGQQHDKRLSRKCVIKERKTRENSEWKRCMKWRNKEFGIAVKTYFPTAWISGFKYLSVLMAYYILFLGYFRGIYFVNLRRFGHHYCKRLWNFLVQLDTWASNSHVRSQYCFSHVKLQWLCSYSHHIQN